MKPDSFRGRSEEIRTTRRLPEHFPKGFSSKSAAIHPLS
jgi:hypothetical protein